MVTVIMHYFQCLNILYYWTNSRQTKPGPNNSKKGFSECVKVAQNQKPTQDQNAKENFSPHFVILEAVCYNYSLELYQNRYKLYSPGHDPYDATSNRGQSRGHS